MKKTFIAAFATLGLCASGPALAQGENPPDDKKQPATAEAKPAETRQVSTLQAREVIERLKTMRAQLLLEQEYNRLLEVRVERMELEAKLGGSKAKDAAAPPAAAKATSGAPAGIPEMRAAIQPPPQLENAADQLVVKAVTVAPFKEAIVMYRGRVYTVRPGDKLGNIEIRDIVDSGVVTAGAGQKSAVMLGQ